MKNKKIKNYKDLLIKIIKNNEDKMQELYDLIQGEHGYSYLEREWGRYEFNYYNEEIEWGWDDLNEDIIFDIENEIYSDLSWEFTYEQTIKYLTEEEKRNIINKININNEVIEDLKNVITYNEYIELKEKEENMKKCDFIEYIKNKIYNNINDAVYYIEDLENEIQEKESENIWDCVERETWELSRNNKELRDYIEFIYRNNKNFNIDNLKNILKNYKEKTSEYLTSIIENDLFNEECHEIIKYLYNKDYDCELLCIYY